MSQAKPSTKLFLFSTKFDLHICFCQVDAMLYFTDKLLDTCFDEMCFPKFFKNIIIDNNSEDYVNSEHLYKEPLGT